MTANGGSSRDAAARRRRIAERGSDRLALITGRLNSIPSSLSSPSVAQSPSISLNSDELTPSDKTTDFPLNTESEPARYNVQQVIPKPESITNAPTQESFEPTTLTNQNPPIPPSKNTQKSKLQTHFSPNHLRPAMSASQNIRTNCSIIIAILVLLSHTGFPILGSNIVKQIILSRPLLLLISTNITIVAARLLLEKAELKDNGGSWNEGLGLAMALEWGLLLKSGLGGLFMDCSVYSVVVICGMSFLKKLGY